MTLKVVVFYVCIAVTSAALSRARLEPKPEKFKDAIGCYIEEFDTVIEFGTSSPSKRRCMEYRCGQEYVVTASCGVSIFKLGNRKDCRVVENKDKPYPGCCKKLQCDDLPILTI